MKGDIRLSRVAIIDSGIDCSVPFATKVLKNYQLEQGEQGFFIEEGKYIDEIGHGTAVASILTEDNFDMEIFSFRIFKEDIVTLPDELHFVLNYILEHQEELKIEFINISSGMVYTKDYCELISVCKKLVQKGCVIISAFDNDGAISYPAAIPEVIGVDVKKEYEERGDIYCCEEGIINYFVPDIYYRVYGLEGRKTIVKGTSYACAKVSRYLIRKLDTEDKRREYLKKIINKISYQNQDVKEFTAKIKKAIIFPYNKESDVLIRNKELLGFEIVKVCDEAKKGNINKKIKDVSIESYKKIIWNDEFDTVILSCTEELGRLTHIDYKKYFFDLCNKYGKYLYSFESLEETTKKCFYPRVDKKDIPNNRCGKLRLISIPVVAVVGTSSKQGKFTLQLQLKKVLEDLQYDIGFLATEPSGYLFDADYVFPMGYNSTVNLKSNIYEYITILNEELWKMQIKGKELIIVGSQSGSIPYDTSNLSQYTINQYGLMMGTLPDAYILVINVFDEIEYIKKTVTYLNSITNGKVLSLCVFPIINKSTVGGINYNVYEIEENNLSVFSKKLEEELQIPVLCFSEISRLAKIIINFF